jgi:thiosulfate dehydrogenase
VVAAAACAAAACGPADPRPDAGAARSAAPPPPAAPPIPDGPLGASIRRGRALVLHTPDSLPRYAPGRVACTSCHLDGGRVPGAAPLVDAHARYPTYLPRSGAVVTLADRVNYCVTRSLAGRPLPAESREMADVLAYLAFLSAGRPVRAGAPRDPRGLPPMPALRGDSARGAGVYAAHCAACHGPDGAGNGRPGDARVPALWGPRSYAVGASMAREERAASFIWHNMPLGRGRSLTRQQAFDAAAFVNAHPRPDSPGKADDWPAGGAPADVPYATRGHAAHRPPPLLPRADAEAARVLPPPPAPRGGA